MRSRLAITCVLLIALLAAGCSSIGLPALATPTATEQAAAVAAVQPTPTEVPASPTEAPAPPTAVPTTTGATAAIKALIEKANQEQQDAFTKSDPTIMKDTATDSYYSQIAQINDKMAAAGYASIRLLGIEWGPIATNGSASATATTYETWRAVLNDGTTQDSRDRNVYTLVLQNGAWLIQSDVQPDAQSTPTVPTPLPAQPVPNVTPAPGQDSSHNWSGYAATGGKYTSVTGTWIVPSPQTTSGPGLGATWVGIGGTSSRDLIQAGTQEVTDGQGHVTYNAWTELLPAASENVPLVVSPGDSVTVSIAEQSTGHWQIVMKNNTTGQDYTTTVQYSSSRSSAEWIVEAPTSASRRASQVMPLDYFGSIQFTDASATKDGKTVTIAQAKGSPILMVDTTRSVLASPSALTADGKGFTVTRSGVPASTIPVGPSGRRRG